MRKEIITDNATVTVYEDPFNKRIRIDDYAGDLKEVNSIINKQIAGWVEKLIVKSRAADVPFFLSQGFSNEAFIKGYFAGEDMYFVTNYFSPERERREKWEMEQSIIKGLLSVENNLEAPLTDEIEIATQAHASALTSLYREVFKVYPTPLREEDYVRKTMLEDGTLYVYIEEEGKIVSAASAEVNWKYRNAELTDCATLPQAQGKGHMKKLLYFLEQQLREKGITCCYTIARAESLSMNKAFAQLDYKYGGRLVKNCIIYSGLEDMNVWYK